MAQLCATTNSRQRRDLDTLIFDLDTSMSGLVTLMFDVVSMMFDLDNCLLLGVTGSARVAVYRHGTALLSTDARQWLDLVTLMFDLDNLMSDQVIRLLLGVTDSNSVAMYYHGTVLHSHRLQTMAWPTYPDVWPN